jgi:4-hydroxybenzoate polyprenyltransferase
VWIAGKGSPTVANVLIFGLGVVLMRAAGCCINDFADRKVDGHVKRTADRPLASGKSATRSAGAVRLLVGVSFLLVLCTNAAPSGCRSARWRWRSATRS